MRLLLIAALIGTSTLAHALTVKLPDNCSVELAATGETPKSATWSGKCRDGKAYGNGKLVVKWEGLPPLTYEGHIRKGSFGGGGKYTSPRGMKYSGNFKDGLPNGRGHLTDKTGFTYEGTFAAGTFVEGNVTNSKDEVVAKVYEGVRTENFERSASSTQPVAKSPEKVSESKPGAVKAASKMPAANRHDLTFYMARTTDNRPYNTYAKNEADAKAFIEGYSGRTVSEAVPCQDGWYAVWVAEYEGGYSEASTCERADYKSALRAARDACEKYGSSCTGAGFKYWRVTVYASQAYYGEVSEGAPYEWGSYSCDVMAGTTDNRCSILDELRDLGVTIESP